MHVRDLPLPLRLRNSLLNAGITTDTDIHALLAGEGGADAPPSATTSARGSAIPGVGPTGMSQLKEWAARADAQATHSLPEKASSRVELDETSRWNLPIAPPEPAKLADVRGWTVTKSGPAAKSMLVLTLEPDIQAQIEALIPTIKALPHVKELGVEVSAETVGRMALIRGLDALQRAHSTKNGAGKPEIAAKSADPGPEDVIPTPDPDADVYETPEGWTKCSPSDKIPVPEAVLHDYYSQNGWFRYWGMVDGTPIYFYWCPEKRLQDLAAFPGADKSGRRIAVQTTPWGPGHVVPTKWANS